MSFGAPTDSTGPFRSDPGLILDALQAMVLEVASPALDRTLAAVDDYLFDRSQNGEEELGLMALRDLRRARGGITAHFVQAVHGGFDRLRKQARSGAVHEAPAGLSLLSDHDLEEQLAVEQLAASVLRVHAPAFELAGKRLVELVGGDVDASNDPLGPAFLARALASALDQHELDRNLHIVILKFFERELGPGMGIVFDRGNALMASAGILRDLRASGPRPPVAGPRQAPSTAGAAVGGAAYAPPANAQAAAQGGASFGEQMQAGAADQALFASMLGMLQAWRGQVPGLAGAGTGGTAGGQPAGPALGTAELMSILSLMQRDAAATMPLPGAGNGASLASQLRQQMAQSARKLGVAGDNLHLDGLDSDAVDLVALLFDVLLDGPQFDPEIRRMIGRMLVPYVKVAVKDRRMFLFKEHPARRLLNTVAEACEGNHGEAPQERELLTRVDRTIDRLVAEFNEDVAIFEVLEQELRAYMAQHRKRFELSEKRAAEAQRGRERLDQARSAVNAELSQHRGERVLPAIIDEFLSRYVSHHLTQVVLRDGHGSPRHEEAMLAVDNLMLAFDHAELRTPAAELPGLPRPQLARILASSGCTGDAAESAIDALRDALARLSAGERAADISTHMPEQVLAPEPIQQSEPEPVLEIVGGRDSLDFDATVLERMRKLQVGNWLQLATSPERIEPAKVSWVSPISGRLLLVNRRGIRVLVASPEELAAMSKLGKVTLREGENMFEDAMQRVAGKLKSAASSF